MTQPDKDVLLCAFAYLLDGVMSGGCKELHLKPVPTEKMRDFIVYLRTQQDEPHNAGWMAGAIDLLERNIE